MNKKNPWAALPAAFLVLILAAALAVGCVSSPADAPAAPAAAESPAPAADAASAASADAGSGATSGSHEGWSVELSGIRKDSLTASYYAKLKAAGKDYVEKTGTRKGVTSTYKGVSLRAVLAMVDGADSAHPYAFDPGLWAKGYEVTLTAADGYSATFSTKDLAPDALILADTMDGKPLEKPMVMGDAPTNLWVRDLASITTSLAPSAAASDAAAFVLDLDINGKKASFTLAQLEKDPAYVEAVGSYTTSAGTKYTNRYGGVKLKDLLDRYMDVSADDSVTFVALDGYEMTYPGSRILDQADGDWLLAFRIDGDYLPKDPGYIRTVKVGPKQPNIEGHLSVRMVKKIVVKEKDFKDFTLSFSGKMGETIDRSTVQSCVSCHRREVTFVRKDISGSYVGFPLYLALAYADDPKYAPHRQATEILSYDAAAAKTGYKVEITAEDGFKVTLDSRELHGNADVILAMYKDGSGLSPDEFPLVLVWDKDAKLVPEGIKNVKKIKAINLVF